MSAEQAGPATEPLHASAQAWSELLRAEVAYVLGVARVPVLHIKGPTVALWLYEDGERPWGDVDLLVPPSAMAKASEVLLAHGFTERYPGVNRQTTDDHAVAFVKRDPALGGDEIDLHDRFEGIGLEAERAFWLLWRRREPVHLAHIPAWFPDLTSRALLVVLNAARDGSSVKAQRDLSRLTGSARDDDWRELVQLATRLEALPALRVGLDLVPESAEAARRNGLPPGSPSVEWRLRVSGASRTALRLNELSGLTGRARAAQLVHWLFPKPAIVRMRDPQAAAGRGALARAYVRRWVQGARGLPPALATLRKGRQAGPRGG